MNLREENVFCWRLPMKNPIDFPAKSMTGWLIILRPILVVYHLCGGLMPLLETVVENGADALETMTPTDMGGDCDMKEACARVGDKLAFIGGFDQNRGFEKGDPKTVREMVHHLFEEKSVGGYIISPSDHFFFGAPENIQAFADAAKECIYR